MQLVFQPHGGGSPTTVTVNLTPASNGCSSVAGATHCSATVELAALSYDVSVSTYDGTNGSGNALSVDLDVPFSVKVAQANLLPLTLDGVPASIAVTTAARAVAGSESTGFVLYGNGEQQFTVVALDADGHTIVGAGAPAFEASMTSGSGWTFVPPASQSPNTIALTPPGVDGSTATIKVKATSAGSACTQPNAVCSQTFTARNDIQKLFVLNTATETSMATVAEYALPLTDNSLPVALINDPATNGSAPTGGVGSAAIAPNGDVFISNCIATCTGDGQDSVTVYAPPFGAGTSPTTPLATMTNGVEGVTIPLAVDSHNDVFIGSGNGVVLEYAPPYTQSSPTVTIATLGDAESLAIDAHGNLWVGNCVRSCGGDPTSPDQLLEYAPPYTGDPIATITAGIDGTGKMGPIALALSSGGTLFASNEPNNRKRPWGVLAFGPPVNGAEPSAKIATAGVPADVIVDPFGTLFLASCAGGCSFTGADTVEEIAPPYTGTPVTIDTSAANLSRPVGLAIDGFGNLIVANQYGGDLTVYASPYSSLTAKVGGAGVAAPLQVLLTP